MMGLKGMITTGIQTLLNRLVFEPPMNKDWIFNPNTRFFILKTCTSFPATMEWGGGGSGAFKIRLHL